MALAIGQDGKVVARGLLEGGGSCVFEGSLIANFLMPERVVISPTTRPKTDCGEEVLGYEDPTPLSIGNNPFECSSGVLTTEVYRARNGSIQTNLLYFGTQTSIVRNILTPSEAMKFGLKRHYAHLDMVKEAEIFSFGPAQRLLIEVGADGKSRLALVTVKNSRVTVVRKFLDPASGTWYSNHVSTVTSPILRQDGTSLLLLNGRDSNIWRVGWAIIGKTGCVEKIGEPFLEPPEDGSVGPGGQRIAFGSFFDPETLKLFYHVHDRTIMVCSLKISL